MRHLSVNPQRWPLLPTRKRVPPMPATPPATAPASWPMGQEVLDLFPTIRAEVARTIAALEQRKENA